MPLLSAQLLKAQMPESRSRTFGGAPCNVSGHRELRTRLKVASVAVLSIVAVLAGCDAKQQKPKTGYGLHFIGIAAAQQIDLVVPPASVSGAIDPLDRKLLYAPRGR